MAKLTTTQRAKHDKALALLDKPTLTDWDKWEILENWQEHAENDTGRAGAFFTPPDMASDFDIDVYGTRIVDLCAGIGTLAFMAAREHRRCDTAPKRQIVCIEKNPSYVAIGKRILPEAKWICGDVFDVAPTLGRFDYAIGNPPFGNVKCSAAAQRYAGKGFHMKLIHMASQIADGGTFIIPQQDAGFVFSVPRGQGNRHGYGRQDSPAYAEWSAKTGITLDVGTGVDTEYFRDQWNQRPPTLEIVVADFEAAKPLTDARPAAKPTAQAQPFATVPGPDGGLQTVIPGADRIQRKHGPSKAPAAQLALL